MKVVQGIKCYLSIITHPFVYTFYNKDLYSIIVSTFCGD